MKKLDAIIIGGLLLLCAALLLPSRRAEDGGPLRAEIYVAGELEQIVDLAGGVPREISIEDGRLLLLAESDGVAVSFADCPNKACQRAGKISLPGQLITCLPNRVVIRLAGGAEPEVDAVAG